MKISELIEKLNRVLVEEGDLEILHEYDGMLDTFYFDDDVYGMGNPLNTIEAEVSERYYPLEEDEIVPDSKRRLVL